MNILLLLGFLLAGGTIAWDHLLAPLPQWLAVVLYTAAVVLFILGMLQAQKKRQ